MAKKVLVLTGSPRVGSNSDQLAAAFIAGANEAGHDITRFDTGRMHIDGCRVCEQCYTKEGQACVFDDDFNKIAPYLLTTDVVVIVTPMYWYSYTAQLKTVLDKIYVFGRTPETSTRATEAALLVCALDPADGGSYEGLIDSYHRICKFKEWKDRGVIVAGNVDAFGEIAGRPELEQARQLGLSI